MDASIQLIAQETVTPDADNDLIDRTISPADLALWSQLRFSLHLAFGMQGTFVPQA